MIEKITLWFTWGTPKLVHKEGVRIHELASRSAADLFAQATTDSDITPVDALNLLDHALELNPILERARYARGQILFERKEYTEAIESFDKALQLAPKHSMALFYAGISINITKDFWGAVINLTDYIRTPDFTDKSWVFAALYIVFSTSFATTAYYDSISSRRPHSFEKQC